MSDPPAGGEFSIFSEWMKFEKHETNHGELFLFFCSHKRTRETRGIAETLDTFPDRKVSRNNL